MAELNSLAEEDALGHVVVQATLPDYEFHYQWVVLVDPDTDQVLWKGQYYVWAKSAYITNDSDSQVFIATNDSTDEEVTEDNDDS